MQNVQNAAEIQQRVINLVELYRTKVGKESNKAKVLAAEYKAQYDQEIEFAYTMHEQGLGGYVLDIQIPEDEVDYIRVNEQLLGYFYKKVAGKDADVKALKELLAEKYDKSVFSEEEETFLKNNFQTLVNYIIQTPCNNLQAIDGNDRKDALLLPIEVIELIKQRVKIPSEAIVYNPFAGFGQFPITYPDCTFFCSEGFLSLRQEDETKNIGAWPYAWLKVATFANRLKAEIGHTFSSKYDAVMSYLYMVQSDDYGIGDWITEKVIEAYNNLKDGGKMILICPNTLCWGISNYPTYEYGVKPNGETVTLGKSWRGIQHAFRHAITSERAIVEIIQLPQVMNSNTMRKDYSILIIEKGRGEGETNMIDARFASKESDRKNFKNILDLEAFDAMLMNQGYEAETGLRKMVKVPVNDLQEDLLIPQTYVVEKPSKSERSVPLSSLCQLVTERVKDVKFDLPLDTPLVTAKNLTTIFNGALNIDKVEKANCPNNPPHTEEYTFDKNGNFVDDPNHYIFGEGTEKDLQVAEYRQSKFLDGSKDAVLLALTKETPKMALYQSTGNPIAVETHPVLGNKYFHVLCPKDGVDALHLLAILRNPIVYRQLQAYEEFGLYGEKGYLKDVLVPTDKRLIMDEISKMQKEEAAIMELKDDYVLAQKKHNTKLEDYQHAMRKHIREISSSVRRMERFINDMDSSEDVKTFLNDRLAVIKTHRLYLSEDIERLNEENTYGEASPFDIDHSLRNYREYFGSDVCPIKYTNEIANDAIRQYRTEHQEELKGLDEKSRNRNMEVALVESSLAYVDIAEYNFGKIVRNILENAKKHGFDDFTDVNCKDCVIEIALNWDKERQMYRIDFRNNGNPLPEGLTKASYGENRKYAGKTGGTGIGGYEVAENVRYYNGDYAISQDGDWIVVSIYLPKSKTYGERL